jgi:hypothetical protein
MLVLVFKGLILIAGGRNVPFCVVSLYIVILTNVNATLSEGLLYFINTFFMLKIVETVIVVYVYHVPNHVQ